MAGPLKRLNSALGRWWAGHKDNHFRIISWVTILSMAATIWGILFLFILDGTTDPTKAEWVPWSWAGLFFGGLIAFWVVPEFFVYMGQKANLDEILQMDNRPEILRLRKEAENAADMLGPGYQAQLVRLYNEMGIKVSTRFRHIRPAGSSAEAAQSKDADFDSAEPWDEINVDLDVNGGQSYLSAWWNTNDSRLSRQLPGAKSLRQAESNRAVLGLSGFSAAMLLYNMVAGFATQGGGAREYTVDLTLWLARDDSIHALAPHFDGVGILLATTSLILLYLTTPAGVNISSRSRRSKSAKDSSVSEEE